MRILITGASGLLGLNACLLLAKRFEVFGVVYQTKMDHVPFQLLHADLSVEGAVKKVIEDVQPDIFLNCAALAQIDRCEEMPRIAERINTWMPGKAAFHCKQNHIPFIHISTDAVFDGEKGGYAETDLPNPLSVYARTKLDGESRVFDANPDALVARVNFYGHSISGTRSLAEYFLNNLLENNPVNGFVDVVFSPLYVHHLVEILYVMLERSLHGLFHIVSGEKISKYDFGRRIAEVLSLDANMINPSSFKDAGLKAKRSPNLFLNINKLKATGIEIPTIDQGLQAFATDFQKKWHKKLRAYQFSGG